MIFYISLRRIVFILAIIFLTVSSVVDIAAQDFSDDPLMLDESDEFGFEQLGGDDFQSDDFGTQPAQDLFEPSDSQFDSGEQYFDEVAFSDETESTLKDDLLVRRELLSQEGNAAPSNLGYGAGTGLMIGTWFAFIRKETNSRQQFRTIGTSTVLGAVIGIMLGTRSVWDPGAPRPEESADPTAEPTALLHSPAGWLFAQKRDAL